MANIAEGVSNITIMAVSLPVKETVYIAPGARAICIIVILLCFHRGQQDLWQRQYDAVIQNSLTAQLSLLNCKLTGGYDIRAEPKTNKCWDIYSFHIAVDATSRHNGSTQ